MHTGCCVYDVKASAVSPTAVGMGQVVTASIGLCDIDIRPVREGLHSFGRGFIYVGGAFTHLGGASFMWEGLHSCGRGMTPLLIYVINIIV